jgi:hypothetical protein
MALAPDMSIAITRPGNVFKGMCNVSIHRLLVVTKMAIEIAHRYSEKTINR